MKKPLIYFRASLDTQHFSFEAFDVTETTARRGIQRALRRHAAQVQVDADSMVRYFSKNIEVNRIQIGHAYRDGLVI